MYDRYDENVVMESTTDHNKQAQVYNDPKALKGYTTYQEKNDEWDYVQITPPPKEPVKTQGLVEISSLPKYAQPAFSNTKHLNRIQSKVFDTAFN